MQSAQRTGEYSPERDSGSEYRGSSDSLYKQPVGENASYYGTETMTPPACNAEHPEDFERGLGSTLIGGAGGAYVGHQMGGGMATAGGAIIGALGANAVSHGLESHHQHQQQQQQQQQQYQQQYQGYGYPPQYYPQYPPQTMYPAPGYQQGMPVTGASYGGGLLGGRFGAGRLAGQDVGRLSHCQRKRLARLERKEARLLRKC